MAVFSLQPTPPYDFDLTAGYLAYFRGRYSADTFEDGVYRRLLDLDGGLALAEARSMGDCDLPRLEVTLNGTKYGKKALAEARRQLGWVLDVDDDLTPFYRMAQADPHLAHLATRFHGLHLPHTATVFEALVLAILGQQISSQVARMLRTLLVQTYGPRMEIEGNTYYGFPRPEALAAAGVAGLRALKFSGRKAEYIADIVAAVTTGKLDLEALRGQSAEEAVGVLTGIRGVGLWTAHWLMVRALGHADGFPHGDLALQRALGKLVNDGAPMSPQQALDYSQRWSPYRSYVTTYIFAALRSDAASVLTASGPKDQ